MNHLWWRDFSAPPMTWLPSVDFSSVSPSILPSKGHQVPAVRYSNGKGLRSCVCVKNHLRTVRRSSPVPPSFNGLCFLCWKSQLAVPPHSIHAARELRNLCHISPQVPLPRLHVPNWKAVSNHGSSLPASSEPFPALPCPFWDGDETRSTAVFRTQVHHGFTDRCKICFLLHCSPNKSWHLTHPFGHTEHGADIFLGLSTWGKWWPKPFPADEQERNDQLQLHSCAVWEKNLE